MKIKILKVGDKVKITESLARGKYRDIVSEMCQYAGYVGTIVRRYVSIDCINYKLDVDNQIYFWYPDALTLIEEGEVYE